MTFTFPASEAEAHLHQNDGSYQKVLLKLRWGALVLLESYADQHVFPLQNSHVEQDARIGRKLVLHFGTMTNTPLSLFFPTATKQKEWTRLLEKCAKWSIDDYYTLDDEVGRGSYGVVRRAICNRTRERVAIKCLSSTDIHSTREIGIMATSDHPNILNVLDTLQIMNKTYLVLPLMQGDLQTIVIDAKKRCQNLIREIMRQILAGVEELHGINLIHRDLKPGNVLCSFDGNGDIHCKIADFGISTQLSCGQEFVETEACYGTRNYSSPEMLGGKPYGIKSDVFSVGCLLFELLTGEVAFDGDKMYKFPEIEKWDALQDSSVGELVNMMLCEDPEHRLSATEALEHRWFRTQ